MIFKTGLSEDKVRKIEVFPMSCWEIAGLTILVFYLGLVSVLNNPWWVWCMYLVRL